MANQKNFAITPSVSISRSKFKRPSQHKTAFDLGKLIPIYVDSDILPGDTVSLDLAALIRMSTPIAPIMDNIYVDYYAFFVPNRLVWDNWKQFMGENTSSFGAATEPTMPTLDIALYRIGPGRLGDFMGLPTSDVIPANSTGLKISALPGRAYFTIVNEWFRDQNIIAPYLIYKDNSSSLGRDQNNQILDYNVHPFVVAKESDYFTRALPYAQKGSPVSLPLGATAPVGFIAQSSEAGTTVNYRAGTGSGYSVLSGFNQMYRVNTSDVIQGSNDYRKIVADLSGATAATINQLRFAFQYQKFLEKDALYGTRYWEILKGHFGITAPDASLQRPELLGHFRQHINVDQVLQTTGYSSTPGSNSLGTPGANSVSGKSEHLISKSFVEHGTLMILACARHDQTYGQGVNRMWTRTHRTDYYFPVFANLGAQEIKTKELYCGDASKFEDIFGYQEAWAEYRYKPSICTNLLNPNTSNSLAFWTLTNRFGSVPTLSRSFIEQDRTALKDALVTGNNGPDFIADFYFDATYVRPMPMYSLPGLIDHH